MNSGMAVSASLKLWIVSATSAIDPEITMTRAAAPTVTSSATKEILTARMPRRDDSSAVSMESAASWLCGAKIPTTIPLSPRGCSCSWSWLVLVLVSRLRSSVVGFEVGDGGVEDDAGVLVGERVEDPASAPFGFDDAVRAQQAERVRDGGLVGVGPGGEVADAGFVVGAELHEDPQTGGVGEHVEQLGHDDDVLVDGHLGAVAMFRGSGARHCLYDI